MRSTYHLLVSKVYVTYVPSLVVVFVFLSSFLL